ncbi:glycosyltransferase family 2 protein [Algoriphagus halophytocola]|uniref:Glycosyltransferase family 2 protein n=1 Tax=Algoriphagus halophytocola TaxID=2991499 RepID=A0ABY6MKG5_9BACT|nr:MULTISPECIES: glycosyltransferase family 2 protein [unclassified Algoriphagus]UZD22897.1 glycosyltransferase family 2 protein [Algoriphagus sp. TR-M5]WBL44165.1 glycosyltransferase family 2 protein [Algoriphagus sp. TR-M9]
MKVSIVIPSYNYAGFLGNALDSVMAQTWKDWEVWIIDDGSTDQTQEVVQQYLQQDHRVHYHYQQNMGLSHARNKGLSLCTGAFVQFLDADDLLSEEKLRLQVKHLKENPEVSISYCQSWYFHSNTPEQLFEDLELKNISTLPIMDCKGVELVRSLIKRNFTTVSSPLIRRDVLHANLKFPESVSNSEDWYFWLLCALQGDQIQYLSATQAYTKIRVHGGSMSQQKLNMYYGELQLRQWLKSQLAQADILPKDKERLILLNQAYEEKLFEHTMLTGPLWNFKHLKKMYQLSNFPRVIKYHKLARRHQRFSTNPTFRKTNTP